MDKLSLTVYQLVPRMLGRLLKIISGRSTAWVVRSVWDREVGGSNPLAPTNYNSHARFLVPSVNSQILGVEFCRLSPSMIIGQAADPRLLSHPIKQSCPSRQSKISDIVE